ncbi:hypothetical protein [Microbacterium sp. cx-59]|uniref:hypothetical protein n=1 Tax=Microbacterium sp. cx-59 TaxID=2891207 RepID=UPI001E3F951C|nr:hypothetical protein [Microbacterium sp. cx-59]MCC4906991.1 hypothetical protein [Microbacterium sp. cx-59]
MTVLHPDVMLSISITAAMSRDQYTGHPQPVIDELRQLGGARTDILLPDVGRWIGYHGIEENKILTSALLAAFPGAVSFIAEGQERRGKPPHGTYEKRA